MYLVFSIRLFSIANLFAVRHLWDVCNEDKCCVDTHRAVHIRVAWLVYVRTYCVPIATLNLACVAGVRKGRGREHALSRAQIPPSPFNACHAGYFESKQAISITLFGRRPNNTNKNVISRGNQWWRREMSAVSSDYTDW